MKKIWLWVALGTLVAAFAWGADYVVERVPEAAATRGSAGYDATKELKWDSGYAKWWLCWVRGRDAWVGNDFDISTISTYRGIKFISIFSTGTWPNNGWDGFRIAVYKVSSGLPGSLLWGPKLVVGSGSYGWKDFSVNWALPGGVNAFLVGQEQYRDNPNCDPFCIDDNAAFRGHSWMNTTGRWQAFYSDKTAPYRNVMIRVTVDDALEVAPTSLGRVKALYY